MKRSLVVAAVAGLALPAAACGGSSPSSSAPVPPTSTSAGATSGSADARSAHAGPGCADDVAHSVTVAAANNPVLTTLVAAVSGELNPQVDLVDTLDGGQFTVFAPVDAAFARLPAATVNALKTDPGLLTRMITYHVLPVRVSPDEIVGEQRTVEGSTITVAGTPDDLTVDGVKVLCGGVRTANATVYLLDGVLTPRS
jgi:uncharacterized surface protein with fasciclin (FAS1) repeats